MQVTWYSTEWIIILKHGNKGDYVIMLGAAHSTERISFYCSFLTTGDSYQTPANRFRVGVSKVHEIVHEVCDTIWNVLQPLEMASPTEDDWKRIENEFYELWNFPNCVGAADGKHVVITYPAKSGSLFFNCKHTFSINLMALVDAQYRFIFVNIGQYGSNADGPVFQKVWQDVHERPVKCTWT